MDGSGDSTALAEVQAIAGRTHPAPSTKSPDVSFASRQLLELELMHRWSTTTYKDVCSCSDEHYLMQVLVPRDALKYAFLMDGILALAALDMVRESTQAEAPRYARTALELYGRAVASYRAELGAASIAIVACPWLETGPLDLAKAAETWSQPLQLDLLDNSARTTIARLKTINDRLRLCIEEDGRLAGSQTPLEYASYQAAIRDLERCFVMEVQAKMRGICIGWPTMVDQDYASAVKRSEAMALLVLMHWAALVDTLGKDVWWASKAGKNLVFELTDVLQHVQPTLGPDRWEAVAWVRQRVGLPFMFQMVVS